MVVTFGTSLAASASDHVANLVRNDLIQLTMFILLMVSFMTLICSESIRKKVPQNYIWLGIFTIAESVTVASIAA